jgi:hypothetical protein
MLRYIFSVCLLAVTCKSASDKPITVSFNGGEWLFPLTVGEAEKRYNLSFKPPGYFYTQMKNGSTVHLEYNHRTGFFFDENLTMQDWYERPVASYVHTFQNHSGLLDSLRQALEKQFQKKMVIRVDTQRFGLKNMSASLKSSLPNEGIVPYHLMNVDSSLIIGLRQKPSMSKDNQAVEVLLFYNYVEKQIRLRMISF